MEINWWERTSSFGTFVDDDIHSGVVCVGIPEGEEFDISKVVTEHFEYDCDEMFDEYGLPLKQYMYIEDPDNHVCDGLKWMYTHEYMDAIGSDEDVFPFQHAEQLESAIKYGIIDLVNHSVSSREMVEGGKEFNYYFHTFVVKYKGVDWIIKFGSLSEDKPNNRCFETERV
ncbi:hypothetical protein HPMBJEAJ_00077 [Aeromonas phage avDM6]|nr:hypothetical protein HPMBJEAJ_00077 [Aeromonas phage avDM6]